MKNKENIYIVREYMLTDDFGGIRIDEEAVFLTIEEANNFLTTLFDKDAEGKDFLLLRIEIIECSLRKTDAYSQRWVYNVRGELLDTLPPKNNDPDTAGLKSNDDFEIGDIIYIIPKVENGLSPSTKGTYGVIVETPSVHEQAKTVGGEDKNIQYTVYIITDSGLLDHVHTFRATLCKPNVKIPTEYRILELISKHLKNEKLLSESIIIKLLNEDIFVKNIKLFDFNSEGIKDPFQLKRAGSSSDL